MAHAVRCGPELTLLPEVITTLLIRVMPAEL